MRNPRPFVLAVLLVSLFAAARPLPAQTSPLGQVAANFGFSPSRLLADPVRPRMYAAVPKTNSVSVIDTHTLQVIADVFVGPNPVDLSISPDGSTLYTANADSTVSAIGALDLNTLQALPSISLPASPYSIAAGLAGRLYVSTGNLLQVDAATGTVQATLDTGDYSDGYLQISPDGKTLYVGTGGIQSFDVSTPTATVLQANGNAYDHGVDSLRLSHDGKSICGPNVTYSTITLYSTRDLNAIYGQFDLAGDDPGPLAFSADDAVLYEVTYHLLRVFSASTFVETTRITLPFAPGYDPLSNDESYVVYDLATDSTGSFLFVSASNGEAGGDNLVALATGRGTLTPPTALPTVSLTSDTPQVHAASGERGRFTLTRTGDLSQPLTVAYTMSSTASASLFIKTLKGTKIIKAGHASAGINVVPYSYEYFNTDISNVLKLQLQPSFFFNLGKAKAKMTISQ